MFNQCGCFSGGESEGNYHDYGGEMGILLSNKGRSLAEGPSYSSGENGGGNNLNGGYGGYGGDSSLLILAPRRTHRKDPIDGFKYYNGGWNISERHYWAVSTPSVFFYLLHFVI